MTTTFLKLKLKRTAKVNKCIQLVDYLIKTGLIEDAKIDLEFTPKSNILSMNSGEGSIYNIESIINKFH